MQIADKVKSFPLESGVYIMHSKAGTVIYVGKAKSLRKRVSQYFLPGRDPKTTALVSHIADIEYIITSTEYEALILENNLIKKYKPRYNIDLKDDKTYQMIKITHEDFPRVIKTRRRENDKGKYFGPFPKGKELDLYYKMLENLFSFRRCNNLKSQKSLCIYYHIGKCLGPCVNKIDVNEYIKDINKIEGLLKGDTFWLEETLDKKIKACSRNLEFEEAEKYHEVLLALRKITEIQSVGNQKDFKAKDYIALFKEDSFYCVELMQYRGGNLIGNACYRKQSFGDEDDIIHDFIMQYYTADEPLPDTIYLSFEIDKDKIEQYFLSTREPVKIVYPESGNDYRILQLALYNARENLLKFLKKKEPKGGSGPQSSNDFELDKQKALFKILTSINKIGKKKAEHIIEIFKTADNIISLSSSEISNKSGISQKDADKILETLKINY